MNYRTRLANYFVLAAGVLGFSTLAIPAWGQGVSVINEDLKLLASDGEEFDNFGNAIAIADGIIAVGAYYDDDNDEDSGSAYVFDASTGAQLFKLLPSDGVLWDVFGSAIAIDNGIIAVGAPGDDDNGYSSGSVYLFDAATGAQLAKLLPADGNTTDLFGSAIAISNGIVAVGVPQDDDNGNNSGSAYLFDASTGIQLAKLLPDDGNPNDLFGSAIAIDNGIVAVGARNDDDNGSNSGSAYLFDAATGAQRAKLLPGDGAELDEFGYSIAIDQGIVAVGAWWDDDNGYNFGSAYLFDAATGTQRAKLLPNASGGGWFGISIAINNGIVAVGMRGTDNGSNSGSAYLFNAATGTQIAKLLPSDGTAYDRFGNSITIDNGVVVVGVPDDNDLRNGDDSGSAYVFDVNSILNCFELTVANLVAGQSATFTLAGGTPGAKAVTVYGTQPGQTSVNNYAGYCATFGIKGVNQSKVLGGLKRIFDSNSEITFNLNIPGNTAGLTVFFQSAEQNTCPDECLSNLIEAVVQ